MLGLYKRKGFTLVEIMIASLLGSFIMLVAVGALRAITTTSERMTGVVDTASEVRFAAREIETNLINFYRDSNSLYRKLVGEIEETPEGNLASITFYTVGRTKARFDQPEGDVYEVEYFLSKENGQSKLFRRLWPNPDKDSKPAGILTELAENIELFAVRYFDGQKWYDQWSSEPTYGGETLPDLVEITLLARAPLTNDVMAQTVVVNLKSNASATNTLEAIEQAEEVQQSQTGTSSTGTASSTGGS
jgi:type II secretion system protein J